jgi:hypothetical protein
MDQIGERYGVHDDDGHDWPRWRVWIIFAFLRPTYNGIPFLTFPFCTHAVLFFQCLGTSVLQNLAGFRSRERFSEYHFYFFLLYLSLQIAAETKYRDLTNFVVLSTILLLRSGLLSSF